MCSPLSLATSMCTSVCYHYYARLFFLRLWVAYCLDQNNILLKFDSRYVKRKDRDGFALATTSLYRDCFSLHFELNLSNVVDDQNRCLQLLITLMYRLGAVEKLDLTVLTTSRTHMFRLNLLQNWILDNLVQTQVFSSYDMLSNSCLGLFTLYTLVSTRLYSCLLLLSAILVVNSCFWEMSKCDLSFAHIFVHMSVLSIC